jgi:D-alanyl-D-alanine carboxypeptidase (penicillin-binding protein 5/6)
MRYLLILFSLLCTSVQAQPVIPSGPQIAAKSHILMDFHSGQILQHENINERAEPASLTKLMTAYIVFSELKGERIKLTDKVVISEKAWKMEGSRMYIEVNTEVLVEDLLKGMIIQSGNDASVALAEFVAGSEETFASLMNQYAKRLGLTNTHFVNSTGMPAENHYTTTLDMAKMAAAIIRDFPEYYKYYGQKEFTYNNITQNNRNALLWRDANVDGMKTGYTESAQYCLVSSAKQDNMRLIAVVMGAESRKIRTTETQKLLTYGFRFFETYKLFDAGQTVKSVRIWQGEQEEIKLGLKETLYVTIPRGQYNQLKSSLELPPRIEAPMSSGTTLGKLTLTLHDKPVTERPLMTLENVAKGNLLQQLKDYVLSHF